MEMINKRDLIKFIDKTVVPQLLLRDNVSSAGLMAGLSKVLEETDVVPTIDAVPVVRCRECKYARPLVQEEYVDCIMWRMGFQVDGFCHMGAKMDEPSP